MARRWEERSEQIAGTIRNRTGGVFEQDGGEIGSQIPPCWPGFPDSRNESLHHRESPGTSRCILNSDQADFELPVDAAARAAYIWARFGLLWEALCSSGGSSWPKIERA